MIHGLPRLKDRINNQGNQGNQINPGSDIIILPDYFVFLLLFRKKKVRFKALKKFKLHYFEKLTEQI